LDDIIEKEISLSKEFPLNFDFSDIKNNISNRFKYSEKVITSEGTEEDFLKYNYEGFPLIASISKLTKIQSDIRYIEDYIYSEVLLAINGDNFTKNTLLLEGRPSYYTTDVVDASIVVGKKDPAYVFDEIELKINDRKLLPTEYTQEKGRIILNKRIFSPGQYSLSGFVARKDPVTQKPDSIFINSKINIVKEPTSAVISADNMRVFYRKLQNPTSISIPGVADNTIVPSSNGGSFQKTLSGWKVTPTTNDSIMKIKVSGKLNNQTKIFDGGEFRIKNPPDGIGSINVNGNYSVDGKSLTKLFINNGIVTGTKPKDFDYKYDIVVTSFDVKVGRLPVQNVNGNRVNRNAAAVDDVESQPKGTPIRFQNIKAKTIDGDVVNEGYEIMPFTIFIK
jgi:gliding motility-associated protein GldM